ncbi:uncharacterized protein LOC116197913 [Punica granatum]|nr:uncharacterized protein LOC116197913 [Punica granatum]PKI35543.1 hypothetical protein CRG98_043997 [Punica granatum]
MVVLAESRHANAINQTELHKAMADMRARSYHGFVILLNILNTIPVSLQRSEKTTFLMLDDRALSGVSLTRNSLQDFILRHSIPSGLSLNELMRLPNGTLVPSGMPKRMISITNRRRTGLFVNNARIVTPNVCLSSVVRCHGISSEIRFKDAINSSSAQPLGIPNTKLRGSKTRKLTKSSAAANQHRITRFN